MSPVGKTATLFVCFLITLIVCGVIMHRLPVTNDPAGTLCFQRNLTMISHREYECVFFSFFSNCVVYTGSQEIFSPVTERADPRVCPTTQLILCPPTFPDGPIFRKYYIFLESFTRLQVHQNNCCTYSLICDCKHSENLWSQFSFFSIVKLGNRQTILLICDLYLGN